MKTKFKPLDLVRLIGHEGTALVMGIDVINGADRLLDEMPGLWWPSWLVEAA